MNPLKTDKFPYLFGILFLIIGWGITHIADQLTKSPIIEYSVTKSQIGDIQKCKYQISNITKDKDFKKVRFIFNCDGQQNKLISKKITVDSPILLEKSDTPTIDKSSLGFNISEFQPGTSFQVEICKLGNRPPTLRFSSSSTILFLKSKWYTCLLKNEFILLLFLIGLCTFLLISYMIYYILSKKKE